MRLTLPSILGITMLCCACAAEPADDLDLRDAPASTDEFVDGDCPVVAAAGPVVERRHCGPHLPDEFVAELPGLEYCAELDQRAQDLIAEHATCEDDMHCELSPTNELLGSTCLPSFACYVPTSRMADLPRFINEARALDRAYAQSCPCVVAQCVSEDFVFSVCEGGSCSLGVDFPPLATTAEMAE